jgi:DNA-binding transcriptional regulator YdaS (Cro superfamily)
MAAPKGPKIRASALKELKKLVATHGRAGFARQLGISPIATYKWETTTLPAERALQIHKVFQIPKHKLRPDLWPKEN